MALTSNHTPALTSAELDELMRQDWRTDPRWYGGASSLGVGSPPPTYTPPTRGRQFTNPSMQAMVCSRMGWLAVPGSSNTIPFREFVCAKLTDAEAVVFLIHNDEALVIRDDLNLFPSDALVTQLRVLVG